jgi:hypothetical protein
MDRANALFQAEALDVLDYVPTSTRLDALLDEVGIGVGGQDHYGNVGMRMTQAAADLNTADVGQPSVEEDYVGPGGFNQLGHFPAAAGLADNLEVGLRLQHRQETLPNHLVVVNDQDPDLRALRHALAGSLARIASPLSSPLRTSNVPPSASTWRRLRLSPKWVLLSW